MVIKRTPPRYPRRGPSCLLVLFVIFGLAVTLFVIQNADEVRDVIIPTPTPEPTRSATEYALLAEISQKDGGTVEAIGYYRQALRLDATKPEIYIRYIELLVDYSCPSMDVGTSGETINCVEEALARSEEAIVLAPDNPRVWTAVAAAYMANGSRLLDAGDPNGANLEFAQAVTAAERAIDLNNNDPTALSTAYAYTAGGLVAQRKPELLQDAQIQAETAITLDPNNALARYYMGQVFTMQAFYSAAREQFQLGLQSNPNFADLYIEMAYNSFANSRIPEAIIWFKDALKVDPNNAAAYDGLAYMYLQLGDDVQAEENALQSVTLNPNVARAHGRLGEAYMRNNKFDLAIEEFTKATTLYGAPTETNARFFYLLADAYIRAGLQNCPQAIPLLQAVTEKNQFYGELAQQYLLDCRRAVLEGSQ
ncbi:MAG TPA: tetratricopeptide repeat protein [Chloroflexota bacterium]|nr:tetratricopeptide repeat protein [Chloroflexota bacterium]